jgi:hypothetical protein
MSKKAKLYLVILINIIAWGYVSYKIYGALQGDDDFELSDEKIEIKKINETKKEDTVLLTLNYPDPFLKGGNFSKERKANSSTSSGSVSKPEKPAASAKPKQDVTPVTVDIKYIGLVKNNDKGTQTAMITVNGRSFFVNQKETVEGYTIREIGKNFITLKKGREILVINK